MCASCAAHDLAGVVVDGAVRDREELAAMGFPVYARAFHPQGPLKGSPGSINVPVSCAGVTVNPGDIVVGDGDGLSVVPADEAEAVLERSREKVAAEADLRERVEDGEYLYEIGGYDELFEDLSVVGPEESVR
jgi:4-hydroxy-4-methyl-2-oxoglutarate aldolase